MNSKKEVIKHSSAIQVSNKMNLLQRRAWNILLANAFNELLSKKDLFQINVKDLCNALEYSSHNDKYLKELLIQLLNITIKWNILRKPIHMPPVWY